MTRILVALDDSDASARAGELVHQLFADAEVLAINVAPSIVPWGDGLAWGAVGPFPNPMPLYSEHELADLERIGAEQARDAAASVAHDSGIDVVEPIAATGDVTEAIVRAAHEHAVDLIVVGWTEKGWFARLVDGSVARDLVRSADLPVLVAK